MIEQEGATVPLTERLHSRNEGVGRTFFSIPPSHGVWFSIPRTVVRCFIIFMETLDVFDLEFLGLPG